MYPVESGRKSKVLQRLAEFIEKTFVVDLRIERFITVLRTITEGLCKPSCNRVIRFSASILSISAATAGSTDFDSALLGSDAGLPAALTALSGPVGSPSLFFAGTAQPKVQLRYMPKMTATVIRGKLSPRGVSSSLYDITCILSETPAASLCKLDSAYFGLYTGVSE
jgi:hypothetical protein